MTEDANGIDADTAVDVVFAAEGGHIVHGWETVDAGDSVYPTIGTSLRRMAVNVSATPGDRRVDRRRAE